LPRLPYEASRKKALETNVIYIQDNIQTADPFQTADQLDVRTGGIKLLTVKYLLRTSHRALDVDGFSTSPNSRPIRVIKSRSMRWTGCVERVEVFTNAYSILVINLNETDFLRCSDANKKKIKAN